MTNKQQMVHKKSAKAPATPKAKKASQTKKAPLQDKKLSALDAAAKVLQETGQPMNCQEDYQKALRIA